MKNDKLSADMASLWDAYQRDKDPEVRDQLVENYLPLVNIIAGRLAISLPPVRWNWKYCTHRPDRSAAVRMNGAWCCG